MARPQKNRRVCEMPAVDRFAPDPQPNPAGHAFSVQKDRDNKDDPAGPGQETAQSSDRLPAAATLFEKGSGKLPVGRRSFFPADCNDSEPVVLTVDEYETLRLVDLEGLTHSECARQMNISRTTATEICESARRKVAEAIVCGRELIIDGGSWELCEGNRSDCFLGRCIRPGGCGGSPQEERD